jgi:hypothetical protein
MIPEQSNQDRLLLPPHVIPDIKCLNRKFLKILPFLCGISKWKALYYVGTDFSYHDIEWAALTATANGILSSGTSLQR